MAKRGKLRTISVISLECAMIITGVYSGQPECCDGYMCRLSATRAAILNR